MSNSRAVNLVTVRNSLTELRGILITRKKRRWNSNRVSRHQKPLDNAEAALKKLESLVSENNWEAVEVNTDQIAEALQRFIQTLQMGSDSVLAHAKKSTASKLPGTSQHIATLVYFVVTAEAAIKLAHASGIRSYMDSNSLSAISGELYSPTDEDKGYDTSSTSTSLLSHSQTPPLAEKRDQRQVLSDARAKDLQNEQQTVKRILFQDERKKQDAASMRSTEQHGRGPGLADVCLNLRRDVDDAQKRISELRSMLAVVERKELIARSKIAEMQRSRGSTALRNRLMGFGIGGLVAGSSIFGGLVMAGYTALGFLSIAAIGTGVGLLFFASVALVSYVGYSWFKYVQRTKIVVSFPPKQNEEKIAQTMDNKFSPAPTAPPSIVNQLDRLQPPKVGFSMSARPQFSQSRPLSPPTRSTSPNPSLSHSASTRPSSPTLFSKRLDDGESISTSDAEKQQRPRISKSS